MYDTILIPEKVQAIIDKLQQHYNEVEQYKTSRILWDNTPGKFYTVTGNFFRSVQSSISHPSYKYNEEQIEILKELNLNDLSLVGDKLSEQVAEVIERANIVSSSIPNKIFYTKIDTLPATKETLDEYESISRAVEQHYQDFTEAFEEMVKLEEQIHGPYIKAKQIKDNAKTGFSSAYIEES